MIAGLFVGLPLRAPIALKKNGAQVQIWTAAGDGGQFEFGASVRREIAKLLANPGFIDALPGFRLPDSARRIGFVRARVGIQQRFDGGFDGKTDAVDPGKP